MVIWVTKASRTAVCWDVSGGYFESDEEGTVTCSGVGTTGGAIFGGRSVPLKGNLDWEARW